MEETQIIITSIICGTVLLSVLLLVLWRLKSQKQETLQKLIDQDKIDPEQLIRMLSPPERYGRDFRRGLLLVGIGVTLGAAFWFMGGTAWMLSLIPIAVGAIYLLLWRLNAPRR